MILRFVRDDPMTFHPAVAYSVKMPRDRNFTWLVICQHIELSLKYSKSIACSAQSFIDVVVPRRPECMMTHAVDAIGAAGAILTTICWVPQAVKIIRERETRAISLPGTTCARSACCSGWSMGSPYVDGPLIGSSIVTFAMTATIWCSKSATADRTASGEHAHRLAVEKGADIVHHAGEESPVVLRGDIAEVRREHDIVELAQGMIERQRLDIKDVKPGAGDAFVAQARRSGPLRRRSGRARC